MASAHIVFKQLQFDMKINLERKFNGYMERKEWQGKQNYSMITVNNQKRKLE